MSNARRSRRRQAGYLLLELIISAAILATATAGIFGAYQMAHKKAMYVLLQNRVTSLLRNHAEMILASPYEDITNSVTDQTWGRKLDVDYTAFTETSKGASKVKTALLADGGADSLNLLMKLPSGKRYEMDSVKYDIYQFPNIMHLDSSPFAIVNIKGVWTYDGRTRTNVIQVLVTQ